MAAGEDGRTVPLPRELTGYARDVLAGRAEPVTPRDAATVMLLRPAPDGSGGFEVYLLERQSSMRFAPGAYVFPGGSVDPRDSEPELAWAGPPAAAWARQLGVPDPLARALVCAAVRETFEESGVLLAGPSAGEVVADTRAADWESDRLALLDRSLSMTGMLKRRGLVLRSDLLRPWSRWITPAVERRRYDTRFFAAELPAGQRTRDVGGEAAQVAWVAPGDAIAAGRRGEIHLMLPTSTTLSELAACGTIAGVLSARRQITAVEPEVRMAGGELRLHLPGKQAQGGTGPQPDGAGD
jgi:8-oxo-dGTP pyrophosphatase MutT (NUDIX family)